MPRTGRPVGRRRSFGGIGGASLIPLAAAGCLAWLLSMAGCVGTTPASAVRPAAASIDAAGGGFARSADGIPGGTVIPVDRLPGWQDDDLRGLHRALLRQCALARPPAPWPALCAQLPAADGLRDWIEQRFVAHLMAPERTAGSAGTPPDPAGIPAPDAEADAENPRPERLAAGLLTGYYEPILPGTRERTSARQTPVYGRPADLVAGTGGARLRRHADGRVSAYPDRAHIETQGLAQAPVLCWLDDPVEAFFLHVQGSGRVRLPDGSLLHLGFADHNGQRYHAIGRELIRRGAFEAGAVTAQSIRDWLHAHPDQMREILHSNPRYIFFRELPAQSGAAGPPGALGVALEPGRSVATDPAFVPAGTLLYLDSTHPDSDAPLQRVAVAQDRGAAITGAVRADLFWGSGDEAGRLAGLTRQPLRLWLLSPRGDALPQR